MLHPFIRGLVKGLWSKAVAKYLSAQDESKIKNYIEKDIDLSENFYSCLTNAINGRYNIPLFDKYASKATIDEIVSHLSVENVYKAIWETSNSHNLVSIFNNYKARLWIEKMVNKVRLKLLKSFS